MQTNTAGVCVGESAEADLPLECSTKPPGPNELRSASVIDQIKEVVFQTDREGRWIFLNRAWEEITGFAIEDSLGKVFLENVHPDDRALNQEKFLPLIQRKKMDCRHEIRYLTRDGGFRWVEVFARLTLDEKGDLRRQAAEATARSSKPLTGPRTPRKDRRLQVELPSRDFPSPNPKGRL